jgi:hypothetical protein
LDIIEIEDVIPKLYQDQIEAETTSNRMVWHFLQESGRRAAVETNYSGFFNTIFHADDRMLAPSPMVALLMPLLYIFCDKAKIPLNTLLRIRIGLFPRTMIDVAHHNPHVDFYIPHNVGIYYVNDADGDTSIFNETFVQVSFDDSVGYTKEGKFTLARRISPKKGKMIGFDGKNYHASMHPMKSPGRIAIAFSFT